ncbi:MAG: Glucose-repressible alcohol dehydrogenase transcriptional effector [Thelocarpon impressellum]|nr:MAG: Glucose-repressible alcohol dehydrogenase transcriptional effector [Thelocarpon impressellum]
MADGSYRFQPAGQQFYYQNQQNHHQQRHLPRSGSPVSSGRAGFSNDTPSPSRSPGPQSPAHNLFGMYGQNHQQQGQHTMMNGTPANRSYAMQLNLAQKYQSQQQAHHQQQQVQHQQQGHHHHQQHHQQENGGHQHTFSAGTLSATPHFTPSHLQQNGSQGNASAGVSGKYSEHWQQQLQLVQEARQASSPHYYARTNAHDNKGIVPGGPRAEGKDHDKEERNRATRTPTARQDWLCLDFGGQGCRALSTALFHYTFLDKLYLNFNKLSHLPAAIGQLRSLSHLDLSNNQLQDLPPEMGMLVNLKNLLLFDNQLRTLPYEMGSLFQLDMLGLEGNPLEEGLKAEVVENGTKALIMHLRENAPVTLPPSQRDWIVLDETALSAQPPPEKFSVMTYNMLCDRYATSTVYGYTPSQALSWGYRKQLLLQEIREQNADIVCLQEIDADSFNEYFRAELAYNDYKGIFWPKTRARTMAEKDAKLVDGCATFYKGSKYVLLDKQMIDFANVAINRPDMKGEHDIFNRVGNKDHIAIVTFFENRATGSRAIAVNAHIYWDPAFKDVKLVQTAILMEQVSRLADKYARWPACADKTAFRMSDEAGDESAAAPPPEPPAPSMEYPSGQQIPLIVCGDFNATVGSGVYDLLAHGTLPSTHSDLAERSYGNLTRDGMAHPFSLRSSYANVGELEFTNYTPGFTDVIDYIWYSTNALQVTGLLGGVDSDYLKRVPGFPNYHFPSDHLALLAEFVVKGRKEKRVLPEVDFGSGPRRRE